MGVSSGLATCWVEGGAMLEHAPEDGCLTPGEGDDGLGMSFSLASLAVVVGTRCGIAAHGGAEGCHVEDALEVLVAAEGASDGAGASRLAQDGGEPCGGGES